MKNISITNSEKLNLISNLSTMLRAGIPILSAIGSLSEEAQGNVKKILEAIRTDLLQGKHLYVSFSRFPLVFDGVIVNMIKASEESGTLDVVLIDFKEQIKKDIAFKRKVRSALTYPALVLIVFFAVLFLILVVVIPKIATVFTQLKITLPLPTKILFLMSNAVTQHTIIVVISIILVFLGSFLLFRYQRKKIFPILYSLPVVSRLIRDIDLMRFTRSLHLLLNSGVSITNALGMTENIVRKKEIARAIIHAKQTIIGGKTLSSSFKQRKKIFPGTMIELVQAGEKTGTLDRSLKDISEYFDYKVSDDLSVITTLIEPVMLVMVAILVGAMMLAIIGPIYNLIGQIGIR